MNQHSMQTLAAVLALASQKDGPTNEVLTLTRPVVDPSPVYDLAGILDVNPRGRYLGPPNPQNPP